jgi:translation initiation factor 3 subunit A
MSSYVAHENVLKNAMELKEAGDIEGALEELHLVLHGKKFRGNNIILERVILEMIDICADNLITTHLKEDIGHFRNVCQHTNMTLLENVLKKLKERADEVIKRCEEEDGVEKLKQILSGDEDPSSSAVSAFLSGDTTELNPEELMLLANCNYEQVE